MRENTDQKNSKYGYFSRSANVTDTAKSKNVFPSSVFTDKVYNIVIYPEDLYDSR